MTTIVVKLKRLFTIAKFYVNVATEVLSTLLFDEVADMKATNAIELETLTGSKSFHEILMTFDSQNGNFYSKRNQRTRS